MSSVPTASPRAFVLAAGSAFALYWVSSLVLQARNATLHFGADAHVYALLAQGVAVDGLTRFHPVTIVLGLAWMKLASPLTPWIAPALVLKAMFAAVGATGVWAALSAFAAVMPRRYAVLFGAIFATSLGIWYHASIEESKIVTTTLSVLYIAIYLELRKSWTRRGVVLLTAILLAACLNEIVAGSLVVIPAVDALVRRRGIDLRRDWWIAAHGITVMLAFAFLELVVNGWLLAAEASPSRGSHLGMLLHYLSRNEFSIASVKEFLQQWLFFNIAAPTSDASYGANSLLNFAGNFPPTLANYFASPVSGGLVILAGAIVLAALGPRHRPADADGSMAILLALLAYALLRGGFFLVYLPGEPLLNSGATTLAHLLLLGIPFAASRLPAKREVLAVFAALLFITNGSFIIGR
jgi:hypothetical protein